MVKVEEIQQYGTSLQSGVQAIATAYGDYTKKSFEDTKSFVEKLSGVKSIDKVLEVQTEYASRPTRLSLRSRRRSPASIPISPSRPSSRSRTLPPSSPRPLPTDLSRLFLSRCLPKKKPGRCGRAFLLCRRPDDYRATRRWLSAVPIEVKVVAIWFELVSMKNLLGSLAQFCSTVDVGSAGATGVHLDRIDRVHRPAGGIDGVLDVGALLRLPVVDLACRFACCRCHKPASGPRCSDRPTAG